MFRSETHRCLERALAHLAMDGASPGHGIAISLTTKDVGPLARRLADRLWIEGYELDPVVRLDEAHVLSVDDPQVD